MPHIHTRPGEHDLTVSAFIIRLDEDEPKILLHWHKKQHIYMQFGGHVELNENPWDAIIHELKEESGYDIDQLQLLQPPNMLKSLAEAVLHPYPVGYWTHHFEDIDHYHTDTSFAFVTNQEPRNPVGKGESLDIRAFSAEDLRKASKDEVSQLSTEMAIYIFETCLNKWHRVDTSSIA